MAEWAWEGKTRAGEVKRGVVVAPMSVKHTIVCSNRARAGKRQGEEETTFARHLAEGRESGKARGFCSTVRNDDRRGVTACPMSRNFLKPRKQPLLPEGAHQR